MKALRAVFANEHFTQILGYQKFWHIRTAVLLDFGKPSLLQKRVVYSSKAAQFAEPEWPGFVTDQALARRLVRIANECLRDIGLGYRETTWMGLMTAAFRSDNLSIVAHPSATIPALGPAGLRCFIIEGKAVVTVTALGDEVTASDRAHLQTCLRWLGLPWGIAFHFGKNGADLKVVSAPVRKRIEP